MIASCTYSISNIHSWNVIRERKRVRERDENRLYRFPVIILYSTTSRNCHKLNAYWIRFAREHLSLYVWMYIDVYYIEMWEEFAKYRYDGISIKRINGICSTVSLLLAQYVGIKFDFCWFYRTMLYPNVYKTASAIVIN